MIGSRDYKKANNVCKKLIFITTKIILLNTFVKIKIFPWWWLIF